MDGVTTELDPSQSTLSPNFAQYVYNMLGRGEAAANLPFQPYTGQRFAGPSALQTQAFQGLAGLQMPGQFGMATDMLTRAGQRAQGMGYGPSTFGNFFQAPGAYQPGQFGAGYQAPFIGGPTQFQSTFQAPSAYQPGQISTGLGPVGSVSDYMSPYMSGVSDIEAREAQRQADIARQGRQARFAQAGAYGGARQAIEEAEAQRNLATQIGDIRSRGLQSAYDRALAQRAQEAQLGMTAQEATERARQFGATQGLNTAQLQAQYGLSAQQAQEMSRQFNLGQQMTAAQLQAQFGLDAQKAQELSRQFASQQAMQAATTGAQYGLAGAQQTEASRQFGAQYGLDALRQQMAAAQALGGLGAQQYGQQLQGLQALLGAGATQREIEQQPLEFGYQQWQESLKYPYQQATFMQSLLQGLPLQARAYDTGQSGLAAALQGGLSGLALYNLMQGKKPQ